MSSAVVSAIESTVLQGPCCRVFFLFFFCRVVGSVVGRSTFDVRFLSVDVSSVRGGVSRRSRRSSRRFGCAAWFVWLCRASMRMKRLHFCSVGL